MEITKNGPDNVNGVIKILTTERPDLTVIEMIICLEQWDEGGTRKKEWRHNR